MEQRIAENVGVPASVLRNFYALIYAGMTRLSRRYRRTRKQGPRHGDLLNGRWSEHNRCSLKTSPNTLSRIALFAPRSLYVWHIIKDLVQR